MRGLREFFGQFVETLPEWVAAVVFVDMRGEDDVGKYQLWKLLGCQDKLATRLTKLGLGFRGNQ